MTFCNDAFTMMHSKPKCFRLKCMSLRARNRCLCLYDFQAWYVRSDKFCIVIAIRSLRHLWMVSWVGYTIIVEQISVYLMTLIIIERCWWRRGVVLYEYTFDIFTKYLHLKQTTKLSSKMHRPNPDMLIKPIVSHTHTLPIMLLWLH